MSLLDDVGIVIPAFHRRGYLERCLYDLCHNFPECQVVVVSDDDKPPELYGYSAWQELPYDSGLTAKRNAGVSLVITPWTLMGSDDFDFSTIEVRRSVIDMCTVLQAHPEIDVVVGRHNNRNYHGFLEYVPGEYIKEHSLNTKENLPFALKPFPVWRVDIGPNFFLAKTNVLREIPWDETIRPIGGEHADWFLDLKKANKTVAFLPYANVNEQPRDPRKQHPDYPKFRRRAWDGHALMMKKRNVKAYYGFGEEVNYAAHRS